MKRVLVTGGYGFIASYVIRQLHAKGYEVVTTAHHNNEPVDYLKNVPIYNVDMRDKAGVYSAVEHSDAVIHLAGLLGTSENIRQGDIMNEVNVGGALNVLNAVDNFKLPSVFIGVGNHFENNTYSISKTTAERYALMYSKSFGTPVNVVRALNAIGAGQKWRNVKKILPTFINAALRNEDINVYGGKMQCSKMDMIWVGDVARTLIDVLETKSMQGTHGQIYEAGTGYGFPVWDIATQVKDACGSLSKIVEVPMRAGESNNSVVVAETPYFKDYKTFEDVLPEIIQYYKDLYDAEVIRNA